jgi:hypothetical protein
MRLIDEKGESILDTPKTTLATSASMSTRPIPAANSWRTLPSRRRVSRYSRVTLWRDISQAGIGVRTCYEGRFWAQSGGPGMSALAPLLCVKRT